MGIIVYQQFWVRSVCENLKLFLTNDQQSNQRNKRDTEESVLEMLHSSNLRYATLLHQMLIIKACMWKAPCKVLHPHCIPEYLDLNFLFKYFFLIFFLHIHPIFTKEGFEGRQRCFPSLSIFLLRPHIPFNLPIPHHPLFWHFFF